MATEQKGQGGRIYKSQSETTYQGQARSIGFNPVQAKSNARAMEQHAAQVVADGNTRMRSLQREQELYNSGLRARQQADRGQQQLDQTKASAALKTDQFVADANLKIDQLYQQQTLKQEQTKESAQLSLDASQVQLSGQVESARTKAIGTAIEGLLDLSGNYVQYQADKAVEREKEARVEGLVNAAFDIEVGGSVEADTVARATDSANANDVVRAEDAIQQATPDLNVQNSLREQGVSQLTIENQTRRSNAYHAADDFPTFYAQWVSDADVVYTRPDGSTFTVATLRDSIDVGIVDAAARGAFYRSAGLGDMPRAQVAEVVVPAVRSISKSWVNQANGAINAGNKAARVRSANLDITDGLNAGADLSTVYQQGFAGLYSSGAYVGDKGKAAEDTLKAMLQWAIENKRPDIIQELKGVHKRYDDNGNPVKGTALGRQYASLIATAEDNVIKQEIADAELDIRYAQTQIRVAERDRQLALANAESPEDERRINLEAATYYESLGTPEGDLKADQLRGDPNYSPFTVGDLKEQQEQGAVFTNEELGSLVSDGEITGQEAKSLGWNPNAAQSADSAAFTRASDFKTEYTAQGKAAVLAALSTQGTSQQAMSADDKRIIMEGQGKSIIENIADRLNNEVAQMIRSGDVTDQDIRSYIVNRGSQLAGDVKINKEGQLVYDFRTANGRVERSFPAVEVKPSLPSPVNPEIRVSDYRGYTPQQLSDGASAAAITQDVILSQREVFTAVSAIRSGRSLPATIEDKASALGTNAQTLLEAQSRALGFELPTQADQSSVEQYRTDRSAVTSTAKPVGETSVYDTGKVVGQVSVDGARKAIIGKESAGDFQAVNPDSGALGFAQVMPANVGPWSREILGRSISQREFLRSPDLQMAIINGKLEKYFQQEAAKGYTGDVLLRRVASIWYSGRAGLYNNTRPQYYGAGTYPSIANYTLDVVSRYYGS